MRWDADAIEAHKKRMQEWEREGGVTTHRIDGSKPSKPENKKGGRKNKYGNIKAEADGMLFASKAERGRWMDLRLMEKAGEIKELQRQVKYPLEVNGMHICDYIADMVYEKGGLVVEDVKGYRTEIFKLKKKLMLACHGIEVKET